MIDTNIAINKSRLQSV